MTCSPERLTANRANATKSTGPRTPEGKAISRRNGLKHGLTGEGVALPNEDAAEVERRFANFDAEMNPQTELGKALALRTAMLTVRLERCYRNEAARLTVAVDSAEKKHDEAVITALNALMNGLGDEPATNAYLLQQTPAGLQLTIEEWQDLKADLLHPERKLWTGTHHERAENLMGKRTTDLPRSRIGALSRALWYDFSALDKHEASDLNDQGKYEYARDRMVEIIDGRIAIIRGRIDLFDPAATARARAASADRALFDTLPESILARKYEAATERSLFRTLREFREVEAAAKEEAANADRSEVSPETTAVSEALGSSLPGDPTRRVAVSAGIDPDRRLPISDPISGTPGSVEGGDGCRPGAC